MSWKYGGTRVYVRAHDGKSSQIIARLQPLNAGTILHIFGYEDEVITVAGLVATSGDMETLKARRTTGTSYVFSGPEGIVGNYYLGGIQWKRLPTTCLILFDRPGLSETAPTYDVTMELLPDG
jgi:hypothetical protein